MSNVLEEGGCGLRNSGELLREPRPPNAPKPAIQEVSSKICQNLALKRAARMQRGKEACSEERWQQTSELTEKQGQNKTAIWLKLCQPIRGENTIFKAKPRDTDAHLESMVTGRSLNFQRWRLFARSAIIHQRHPLRRSAGSMPGRTLGVSFSASTCRALTSSCHSGLAIRPSVAAETPADACRWSQAIHGPINTSASHRECQNSDILW